ncbi:MAG TPA: MFS transporter [Feifaniaceae bacterium]|nr:MFS transporter [Feifaniaceae bacterium]
MTQTHWKRTFFTILGGQAVSLVTSAIVQMALIFYLTEKTDSALILSLASMAGFLPYALLGPFIGVWVDRYDRKRIMIGADLLIALCGAGLAAFAYAADPPVWLVLTVLALRSAGTAFHSPALNAVTPLLVPEDQLTRCAGYSQALQSISYIVSPAVAAMLYTAWSLTALMALDVAGALIACATVARVTIPKLKAERQSARFFAELKEGFKALSKERGLFALLLVGTIYMLVYMPINALYPLMSMRYFSGTPAHVSATEIAYAAGMLLGSLALGALHVKRRVNWISASIALMGAALIASGLLPPTGFIAFVLCCAVMGLSVPFYSGIQTALFQERIPPEYLGRVFSLTGSVMSLAMPLGLMLSGAFADSVGLTRWFFFSGAAVVLTALLCAAIPAIRGLDRPRGTEEPK